MPNSQPFSLDVIIVTKQRYDQLFRCVTHVTKNTVKPNTIIIIDSSPNQSKSAHQKITALCRSKKIKIIIKPIPDLGVGYARNLGIKTATSKYFAFVDDDEYVPKQWCQTIKDFFSEHPEYHVLLGPKIPRYKHNYWNQIWHLIVQASLTYNGAIDFVPSGNSCYQTAFIKRKKIYFDERFKRSSEDQAYTLELEKNGAQSYFLSKLHIQHDCRTALVPFLKQWFGYGQTIHQFHHYYYQSGIWQGSRRLKATFRNLGKHFPTKPARFSPFHIPGFVLLNLTFLAGFINSYMKMAD